MDTELKLSEVKLEEELIIDSDSDAYDELSEASDSEIEEFYAEEDNAATVEDNIGDLCSWRYALYDDSINVVHPFSGGPNGLKSNEASDIKPDSTPLFVFMHLFTDICQLLLEETNRYYQQYLKTIDKKSSPRPDVTPHEMFLFLAIVIQMGHDLRDSLKDYWSTMEQFRTPFYSSNLRRDRFLHILRFLHFTNNERELDGNEENFDRLWKIRKVFEMLNDRFAQNYNPCEHLMVDEVLVSFKGRTIFKQFIPKKKKSLGLKILKITDSTGYTINMGVYLGRDLKRNSECIPAVIDTFRQLTSKVEGVGHKLYMSKRFSYPILFDELIKKRINCCGAVRPYRKGMPRNFGRKTLKLKRGDVRSMTRGSLTVMVWKDTKETYMLTNFHNPPEEGNLCDWSGNVLTPAIVEDYRRQMGYLRKGNRMANNYTISRRIWKWTKKLFFHLLDLTILNSWVLLSSCGGTLSHREFRLRLVRNLVEHGSRACPNPVPSQGRRLSGQRLKRLEAESNKHWPLKGKRLRCRVCSAKGKVTRTVYRCKICEVGLCIVPCFENFHTKECF